jgi:hypothetical protein
MNRLQRGPRLAGLHAALGIGRLAALVPRVSRRQQAVMAFRALERETRRSIMRFGLMAVSALLGFWGFEATVAPPQSPWAMNVIWNNLFKTMQLLTTQFPNDLSTTTNLPLQLQIARFAMPVFAIWFTATALLRRFNRPLLAWRAGLARSHVVLIGSSEVSVALAHAYRAMGRSVLAIVPPVASDVASPVEAAGAAVVFGDPDQVSVMRRAAVHRASAVIAADDVGTGLVGLASAVAAANAKRSTGEGPLIFLIRLAHRELRALVATQIASAMQQNLVDLRLYVRERSLARSLLARYPADWGQPPGPFDVHTVIIGLGDMGVELLLQLARIAVPEPGRRTILTAIDRNADGLKEQLLGEHPGLANCAELRFIQADLQVSAIKAADVDAWLVEPSPATAIYVCCGDDHANLSMTIGLRRAYAYARTVSPPVFVYQRTGSELVEALAHMHGAAFDTRRIVAFGRVEDEADPFYLVDEEIDDLARLMHEDYLESRRRSAEADGTTLPDTGATAPWAELADTYRAANRSQADHLQMKLRSLGWHATESGSEPPEMDPKRLEVLAAQEHERWSRDRWMTGWTQAAERNNELLHHPDLRPYAELSEPVRDLDRQTLRRLPALLKEAGMGLSRDHRVGLWFVDAAAVPSGRLMSDLTARLAKVPAQEGGSHLQLVLPLRSAAELMLATTLARSASVGVDTALVSTASGRADLLDRQQARDLIAASDRAYVLSPPAGGETGEAGAFGALCRVCDEVLLVTDRASGSEALLGGLDTATRTKVTPVIHA